MVKRFCLSLLIILLMYVLVFAELVDVVYLKNGDIVKGTIIEQIPNKKIKIQTRDGSVFNYRFDQISRIVKEEIDSASKPIPQNVLLQYEDKKKSGGTAFILSFLLFPGVGHWYCSEVGNGFVFLLVDAALITGMLTVGVDVSFTYQGTTYVRVNTLFYVLGGLAVVSRIIEWVDCFSAAERYNKELRRKLGIPDTAYFSLDFKTDELCCTQSYLGLNYRF